MRRLLWLLAAFALSVPVWANEKIQGDCTQGGTQVNVPSAGGQSQTNAGVSTFWQQSFTSCTVTVYLTGTLTKATIYSDNAGTPLGNPFTSDATGHWFFYAGNGRYDVNFSGGNAPIPSPFTYGDYLAFDPAVNTTSGLALGNESGGVTVNAALYSFWTMTLVGNVTVVDITNPTLWQQVGFDICQNSTGGFSLTWGSQFSNFPVLPNVDVAANACTVASFIYTGSTWQYFNVNTGCSLTISGSATCASTGVNQNVVLTPSGTGVVSSSIYEASGSFRGPVLDAGGALYNVMNPTYGAIGNGIANDQTAIQAAINAAHAAGGGTVYLPHPSVAYYVNATSPADLLTLYSNIKIVCEDQGTIIEAPSGGNYNIFQANGVSNIEISGCTLNGQQSGSSANGILIQVQCSSVFRIDNDIFENGSINLGVDTNSPSCSSTQGIIDHNIFGPTHVTSSGCGAPCLANVQVGDGATFLDIHDDQWTENLPAQLMLDCDGCSLSRIHDNLFQGYGSVPDVSACIQIEATSANVTDVMVQNNQCSNITATQAGLFISLGRISGTTSLSRIIASGNHFLNVNRGEEVTDGNHTGTVSDITFSNEHIDCTTCSSSPSSYLAALVAWHQSSSATWGNVNLNNITVDGCGTADDNGCIVIKGGSSANVVANVSGLTVNAPSGVYALYLDTVVGPISIGQGIVYTGGGNNDFVGAANSAPWNNMGGVFYLGSTPTGTCAIPGALVLNNYKVSTSSVWNQYMAEYNGTACSWVKTF